MLQENLSQYRALFLPGAHTALRAQVNRSRRVAMISGNLAINDRQDTSGISARVYKDGVYGFSSMAAMDADAAAKVIRAATDNALFMDRHIAKGKPALPAMASGSMITAKPAADLPQKYYIDVLRELDSYISDKYPLLASRTLIASADQTEKLYCGSDGYESHCLTPRAYIYVNLAAMSDAGVPVELSLPIGDYGTFDQHFSDVSALYQTVDDLYERLMHKREGVYAEAGTRTCILGGILPGMLAHEAVGHTVEADLVLGGSVAAHSLHKQVASELVSMTDFAHTAFGSDTPLPVYVDDEGTLATDAPLIKNGELVGYMNSRETAQHFGMEPNGNARAYAFSDEPLIRMRNTAIHPGTSSLEEMIASVDDGYYLVETGNGQADTTGEFMFGITMGYEIKKGKIGRAILDTTISGVAFEMLKTVDMVSSDVVWASSGFCGKKQPMAVGMGGPALRCQVTMGGR